MSTLRDCTLLLVDPENLPPKLEEVLVARGAFVETTESEQLVGTLIVSCPDAVVAADEQRDIVCRAIRTLSEEEKIPHVMVARAGNISRLRYQKQEGVDAIVSADLPANIIATRIVGAITKARRDKKQEMAATGTDSHEISVALQNPETSAREQSKAAHASPRPAQTKARTQRKPPRVPPPVVPAKAKPARSHEGIPAALLSPEPEPASADEDTDDKTIPDMGAVLNAQAAQQPAPKKQVAEARKSSKSHPRVRSNKASLSPSPQPLSAKAQRVSLQMSGVSIPATRIALMDEDVVRSDAISRALRGAGHEVFLLSYASGADRWRLLRKFAPQAMVVDELSPALGRGAWLGIFRQDPFLNATPLITCPLASLYDGSSDHVQLDRLTGRLEGLNKLELALLGQLSPSREVEVLPQQLNPARLLRMLADYQQPLELQCNSAGHSLSLHLHQGTLGGASARVVDGSSRSLSADEALAWLLDQTDAHIVIKQRAVSGLSQGESVVELLDRAYALDLPSVEDFVTAGARKNDRSPKTEAAPQPTSMAAFAPSVSLAPRHPSEFPTQQASLAEISHLTAQFRDSSPPAPESNTVVSPVFPPAPSAPKPPSAGSTELESESYERATTGIVQVMETHAAKVKARLGTKGLTVAAAALLLTLGAATISLLAGGSDEAKNVSEASATESPSDAQLESEVAAKSPKTSVPPEANSNKEPSALPDLEEPLVSPSAHPEDYFRVEPDKTSKPCDSLLNAPRSHFTSKPRWQGKALWKKSRHQLLIGNKETSNVLMCQAALVDPVGKASVGLGNYYLSLRSLDEAKSWAEYGIEHRGKHARTSKELLGDVLSQMGDVEGAKRMWLETMQVESDDVITLRTVSRSLTRNASQARQGGDHPLAERLLRRAVLLDEENADAASLLAASLFKNAQAGLAERWAKHALKLDAASGYALLTLGDLAAQAGEPEKARTYYQKIPEQSSASEKVDERLETL